jgi:UDP-N-acetylmuramate--alanine ligase
MDELRALFGGFLERSGKAVINLDDPETRLIGEALGESKLLGYGFDSPGAACTGRNLKLDADGVSFDVQHGEDVEAVSLPQPGRHNASNALAAIAAAVALGVPRAEAAAALARFEGLKRRLETVGTAGGVTVIDDFAHNPDKIAASLATLTAQPGRLLIMFQPHGFGPLAKMGDELAATFAQGLREGDRLYLPDPVYQGGTVDRSRGSDWLAEKIGGVAQHVPDREAIGRAILAEAASGDRVVIMGARDDTLSEFAAEIVRNLAAGA